MTRDVRPEGARPGPARSAELEARIAELEGRLAAIAATGSGGRPRIPRVARRLAAVLVLLVPLAAAAATISVPNVFVNGTVADADEVNANFATLVAESNAQDLRIDALEFPAFVSEWIQVGRGSLVPLNHGLGRIPTQVTIWISAELPDNDAMIPSEVHLGGHIWKNLDSEGGRGVVVTNLTASSLTVRSGNSSSCPVYDTFAATGGLQRVCLGIGFVRILAWD